MELKKLVMPIMAVGMVSSLLVGCTENDSKDLLKQINAGQAVTIAYTKPDDQGKVQGQSVKPTDWVQLDQLKTYNDFRIDFDTLFNINTVTSNNVNGKSGCLYVDTDGKTNGNTTLEDAFRNKIFVEKYWSDTEMQSKLEKLSTSAYKDVDGTKKDSLYGSINAYYDLLTDNVDPSSFNATQSVTREQFYAFEFKASNGVKTLQNDDSYTDATGGKTDYSIYAQQDQKYAYLNTNDNCLDKANAEGSISRAEAVYMVVNKYFPDELKSTSVKEKCYKDCKNAGDLALKADFKEKKDGNIVGKKDWQAFTLAYMTQHPNKGMQEELYKAMVVAYRHSLLGEDVDESRWDEPISKDEALELMTNTFLALDKTQGYETSIEYGQIIESIAGANAGQGPAVELTPEEQQQVIPDPSLAGNSTSGVPSGSKSSGSTSQSSAGKSSASKATGGTTSGGATSGKSTSHPASSSTSSNSSGSTVVDPGWGSIPDHEYHKATQEEVDAADASVDHVINWQK